MAKAAWDNENSHLECTYAGNLLFPLPDVPIIPFTKGFQRETVLMAKSPTRRSRSVAGGHNKDGHHYDETFSLAANRPTVHGDVWPMPHSVDWDIHQITSRVLT